MGLIQNLLKKWKERKEAKKDMEMQQRWQEGFEMKKLSANERELMEFQEEERQKRIKSALEKFRKIRQDSIWRGRDGNPIYAENIIKDDKNQLLGGKSLFFKKDNLFNKSDLFFKK